MKKARASQRYEVHLMSKREAAQLSFSPKQLVCVEMLQEGHHRSFTELYTLLRADQDRRAAAEPGSALSSQTPLEEQADKLQLIRRHLTRAEDADRDRDRIHLTRAEDADRDRIHLTRAEDADRDRDRIHLTRAEDADRDRDRIHLTQAEDADRDRIHLTRAEDADRDRDRIHLTRAEDADRTEACAQRLLLAQRLSAPEDVWLRLHFLHSVEQEEAPEASRISAESKLSLSEEYLKQGDLHRARQQVELLLQQLGGGYLDSDRGPLQLRLYRVTWTTFSRLAAALLDSGDCGAALTLLRRAHSAVTELGDERLEAEAALQLGRTNQSAGNRQAARQFFSSCMQICGALGDSDGLLEAQMATVDCLESEGSHDEAVRCLERVVDFAQSRGLQDKLAETYMRLGSNYYSRAQYGRASDCFLQSFLVSCDGGNARLLQEAQVMVGVTRARLLLPSYMADVASSSPSALRRLQQLKAAGV